MIRFVLKWALRVVLLLVALVVIAVACKDTIARIVLEHRIRTETGMDAHIGRVSFALFAPTLTIENLKVYNTPEFGGGTFLDVPELHFEYDRAALMTSKFHIKLLRVNLAELDIVKNREGKTNVTSLNDVNKKIRRLFPKPKRSSKTDVEFAGIDVLNLSFGKARLLDLKNPDQNRDITINLKDEVVNNLKTEDDAKAALFLIWLRHGSEMGITANDLMSGFGKKPPKKPKTPSTNTVKTVPAH